MNKLFFVYNKKPDKINVVAKDARAARRYAVASGFVKKADNARVVREEWDDFQYANYGEGLADVRKTGVCGQLVHEFGEARHRWIVVPAGQPKFETRWYNLRK